MCANFCPINVVRDTLPLPLAPPFYLVALMIGLLLNVGRAEAR